jgi:putative ABC transport system permease protein
VRSILLRLLPESWRDAVDGDLQEESARIRGAFRRRAWIAAHLTVLVTRIALARSIDHLPASARPALSRWLPDAWHDARYGVRRWIDRPAFAAAAIATLALGIGTTAALFSVVDGVLFKPLPYPAAERLVTVNRTYPEWTTDPILVGSWDRISLAWPEFFHVRARSRTLEALAVVTTRVTVLSGSAAQELRVGVASASFFPMLGVAPAAGTLFAPDDDLRDPGTAIISHELWVTRFGADPSVIGRTVRSSGADRVIAGVLPRGFMWGSRVRPYHLWFPLAAIPPAERADNNRNLDAIGRLRPGVTLADAADEMAVLLREHFRYKSVTGAAVTPLMERALRRVRTPLLLLLAGAVLVLVIACANVAGLLTGDAAVRRPEMAVRASLGATRGRVLRQLFAEGLVLSAIGSAAGLVIAAWGVRGLVALAPSDMPRVAEITVDLRVASVATLASVVTALLFAMLPAIALRRQSGLTASASTRGATAPRRATSALALLEIALGVALLAGAGLFARSLVLLQRVDAGFDRSNLLTLRAGLPPSADADLDRAARFFEGARAALGALPGAIDVAVTSNVAFVSGRSSTTITLLDPPAGRAAQFEAQRRFVSPEYFRTLRVAVLRGRTFDATDTRRSAPAAVVSREMERRVWPGGAVGRTFMYAGAQHMVIGVVNDVRDLSLDSETQATFYLSTTQRPAWPTMHLVVRTAGDPLALAPPARAALARLDPEVPIEDVTTMDAIVYRSTDDERYRAVLMCVFAVAATVLAAVGLYSTLARRVVDRRREIGVRLALGARPDQVRRLFLGEGLRLAAAGTAAGVPLALLVGRSASTLLFGVSPVDGVTLAGVVATVGLLSVVATYIPSARASRLDPVAALRSE